MNKQVEILMVCKQTFQPARMNRNTGEPLQ